MVCKENVITIELISIKDEINFAFKTAKFKSRKNHTQNTWQQNRSSFRKFTDLFPGDLAKNIVRHYLYSNGIIVTDYDKVRTDNFEKNDLYDLMCGFEVIEVKSSVEKYNASIETLVNRRRIIIYKDRKISDFTVQVFYRFENDTCKDFFTDMEKISEDDFKFKYQINDEKEFVVQFIKCSPKALIMGFVDNKAANDKIEETFIYKNLQDANDNERNYIDFFIKDASPISNLITYFKS